MQRYNFYAKVRSDPHRKNLLPLEKHIILKIKAIHFSKSNLFYTFAEKQAARNKMNTEKDREQYFEVERDVVVAELEAEGYEKMKS